MDLCQTPEPLPPKIYEVANDYSTWILGRDSGCGDCAGDRARLLPDAGASLGALILRVILNTLQNWPPPRIGALGSVDLVNWTLSERQVLRMR